MIYVVLGMHKSGTTLISQILHNSGVNMVEDSTHDISYDRGNKYERQSVLALNMEILGARDYEVRDLSLPDEMYLTVDQRKKMRGIIDSCTSEFPVWGFKDPRTVYTYPMWAEELPKHKIIAIFRPPEEIWPRFRWRGLRKRYLNPLWAWQFLSRWVEHNLRIIEYIQNSGRDYLLIDYREMMASDVEINRLRSFIHQDLSDTRRKELYRTRKPRRDICLMFAFWLLKLRRGLSVPSIMEELDRLRSENMC